MFTSVLPKVTFLAVGTQKGGTTSLDAYLRKHPGLIMSQQKEVHFFDNDELFSNRSINYTIYHENFPTKKEITCCECTPSYMFWPQSPERIKAYNPAMKLILLLRNPIERAYSHWNMQRGRGWESLPFMQALLAEEERIKQDAQSMRRYSYALRGRYYSQILHLLQLFSCKQMLILKSEALRDQPANTLSLIADFLDIPPFPPVDPIALHQSDYPESIPDDARKFLQQYLSADIQELEKLLDWDCSGWMK